MMDDPNAPLSKRLPPTEQSLPILLLRARETVMAPIRAMLSDTEVNEQQWRILRVLFEHGPQDASTVAERASLQFPSLTRMASPMREAGLITQRQDPKDRRRQVLALTRDGQKIIDDNLEQALSIGESFRRQLGEERYDLLLGLLRDLSLGRQEEDGRNSEKSGS